MTAPIRFDDLVPKQKGDTTRRPTSAVTFDDLVPSGQPIDFAEQEARGVERIAKNPKTAKDVARVAAQGLPFVGTFLDEAESAYNAARSGRPYSKEYANTLEKMRQFRQENPTGALLAEIGTGLLTGGALTAGARKVGASTLERVLQSPVIQGGLAGLGASEGGPLNRVVGAATGMAGGAAANALFTPTEKVGQRDLARDITGTVGGLGQNVRVGAAESLRNRIANMGTVGLRKASDALSNAADRASSRYEGMVRGAANLLEPTDAIKVKRATERLFPSNLPIDVIEAQAGRAENAATQLGAAVKSAEDLAKQSAKTTTERGKALVTRAEQQAQSMVQRMESNASKKFGELAQAEGSGAAMRQAVLDEMEEVGKEVYGKVRAVKPLPEPPRRIYQQIDKSPQLESAFQYAQGVKAQRRLGERVESAIEKGAPITERVKTPRTQNYVIGQARNPATGEMVDVTRPVLDLETFDHMERWINDQVEAGLSGNASGIPRSQASLLKKQVNRMREDFISAHPPADRPVLMNARKEISQRFRRLELIRDGSNLDRFTLNAPAQMRAAGESDLSELIKEVSSLPPEERKFFEVPARQAVANMLQRSDRSVASMAQTLVGTTQAAKRTALALGDDAVKELQQYLPQSIESAAKRGTARVREAGERLVARGEAEGGRRTQRLKQEAEQLGADLSAQRERARELGATVDAAKRFTQAMPETIAGSEAAEGFAQTAYDNLGNEGLRTIKQYGSAALKRQLKDLSGDDAQRRIQQLINNPATQRQFLPELQALLTATRPGPRVVRPALSRFVGGGLSAMQSRLFSNPRVGFQPNDEQQ